jgi:hypothetical protein
MKKIFFLISLVLSAESLFSQRIGLFYNTDEWADFTYLVTVSSKIENEYKSGLNSIEYCSQMLQNDFEEIKIIDLKPSNLFNIKSKAKDMCIEGNLDYAIVLLHTPTHPDLAADKIRYKMRNKSIGIVAHSMNKKVYYVFFNAEFMLYSKKSDKYLSLDVESYKTYEWFKNKVNIVEDGKLTEIALNDGISHIKRKFDLNLKAIFTAIKNEN